MVGMPIEHVPKNGIRSLAYLQSSYRFRFPNSAKARYSTCMLLTGILLKMRGYRLVQTIVGQLTHAHSMYTSWLVLLGAGQSEYACSTGNAKKDRCLLRVKIPLRPFKILLFPHFCRCSIPPKINLLLLDN